MSIDLQEQAKRHLWMHFTRMGSYASAEVPVIVRGEGCYVYDEHGKRYLDGLSALYCVNIGHGRAEMGQAAARQAQELGFYTNWSYAHPRSIELATRIAGVIGRRIGDVMIALAIVASVSGFVAIALWAGLLGLVLRESV